MNNWDVTKLDVQPRSPEVLSSHPEGRAVVLTLESGASLSDHEVHERAWLVVLDGTVTIESAGDRAEGGVGLLAEFAPGERHEVTATSDARLLLLLTPWPGEGHPSQLASSARSSAT